MDAIFILNEQLNTQLLGSGALFLTKQRYIVCVSYTVAPLTFFAELKIPLYKLTMVKYNYMNQTENRTEGFITIDEAASYLRTKKSWLYQNHKYLKIPHYNLGRKLLFKITELDSWLLGQNQSVYIYLSNQTFTCWGYCLKPDHLTAFKWTHMGPLFGFKWLSSTLFGPNRSRGRTKLSADSNAF